MLGRFPLLREVVAWTIYPLVFGGALLAGYIVLYGKESDPNTVILILIPALIAVFAMEFVSPYRSGWKKSDGQLGTDLIYLVTYQLVTGLGQAIGPLLGLWLVSVAPKINTYWPQGWPVLLQLLIAIHLYDFTQYWMHRLGHRYAILWRFHAIHHSVERLWFANAPRFHVLETLVQATLSAVTVYVLGVDEKMAAMIVIWVGVHGIFQHSNIYFKLGFMNFLFSQAELHRWHHSKLIEESDNNFGNNVILWDVIFGTFYWPKNREVARLGLIGDSYPGTYLKQQLTPFLSGVADKPDDFEGKEAFYEEKIREDNRVYCELNGIPGQAG